MTIDTGDVVLGIAFFALGLLVDRVFAIREKRAAKRSEEALKADLAKLEAKVAAVPDALKARSQVDVTTQVAAMALQTNAGREVASKLLTALLTAVDVATNQSAGGTPSKEAPKSDH